MSEAIFLGIGLLAGLVIGAGMATMRWKGNARTIQRLNQDGEFYKVVKIGDRESEAYLRVHVGGGQ